jgi:hypothetical protein
MPYIYYLGSPLEVFPSVLHRYKLEPGARIEDPKVYARLVRDQAIAQRTAWGLHHSHHWSPDMRDENDDGNFFQGLLIAFLLSLPVWLPLLFWLFG